MKKVIILMIILSLILGLCACGAGAQQSGGSAAQNKPVAGGKTQDTVSGEAAQTPDPTVAKLRSSKLRSLKLQ